MGAGGIRKAVGGGVLCGQSGLHHTHPSSSPELPRFALIKLINTDFNKQNEVGGHLEDDGSEWEGNKEF